MPKLLAGNELLINFKVCWRELVFSFASCVETKGKPWFLKRFTKFEVCPIYECITNKKISRCIDCKNSTVKYFWNGIIRELYSSEVRQLE